MSDKRTQLLEASIDLFADEGFWNTPTSRIAKHAGVATGTLFNYFESKDVLIDEVYVQLKQEWANHVMQGIPLDGTIKEQIEHIWFRHIDWGLRFPRRYALKQQLTLSDLVSDEVQQRQQEELEFGFEMIKQGLRDGLFVAISAEYFGLLMVANLEAAVRYASTHHLKDMALTRHITTSFEIFWRGVTK
jgi:AcrR family transcriptional regulator